MNAIFGAWKEDGDGLHKSFIFSDFPHAVAFVVEVGLLAQAADHHPDVDLRFNKVHLTLLTHDRNAVTGKDRSLSAVIDQLTVEQLDRRAAALFPV